MIRSGDLSFAMWKAGDAMPVRKPYSDIEGISTATRRDQKKPIS
jgi:hypothetical protein